MYDEKRINGSDLCDKFTILNICVFPYITSSKDLFCVLINSPQLYNYKNNESGQRIHKQHKTI